MIFFNHDGRANAQPTSLFSARFSRLRDTVEKHMRLAPKRREQTDIPPVWKSPFDDDVLAALIKMTGGCCAFCERQNVPLEVYRFRPPAYATPTKPLENEESYLWLAFSWRNLYPICAECRPSAPNDFPVHGNRAGYAPKSGDDGNENAQLIFPGELDQPTRYFSIMRSGELIGLNSRAQLTIEHFKLNSTPKVTARRDMLENALGVMQLNDWSIVPNGDTMGQTGNGAWYLFLHRIAGKILDQRGGRLSLSPARISKTITKLAGEESFNIWLANALEEINDEDSPVRESVQPSIDAVTTPSTPEPRLSSVDLTTYKSLEKITFDIARELSSTTKARLVANAATSSNLPEAPCVLILGENATGKSSILEAIALTLMPAEHRERLKVETANLTLNPEYMGDPKKSPVRRSKVEVSFHPDGDSSAGTRVTLAIDGSKSAKTPFKEGGNRSAPVPPVFAYGAHRLYGKTKRRSTLRHVETLFHNDRQLPQPETWLCKLKPHDLDQVVRALRHIIQIDGAFDTIEVDKAANRCKINIEREGPDGKTYTVPQRMDIVSSGYRAVFALVCDVLEGLMKRTKGDVSQARRTPAIVLIDEIEAHLHPRWKLHVITGLRRALPKVTFIITSHDPLCVRGMFDGEVLALNRYQNVDNTGLGMPERVEPVEGFENVEAMTIEQLLTSELFQLLSTDNPETDRSLAHAADLLSQRTSEVDPDPSATAELRRIVTSALPYGQTEIARVVQEAVAEYLKERRGLDHAGNARARKAAKEEIKKRLRALMS
ncbi:MAG: AAA family ATPase [Silicimonas sp.]|nr:AAA family ATPase [Silicimonas sp.]